MSAASNTCEELVKHTYIYITWDNGNGRVYVGNGSVCLCVCVCVCVLMCGQMCIEVACECSSV